jgi:hypothetical protein
MRRCESTLSSGYRQWRRLGRRQRKPTRHRDERSERGVEVVAISAEAREGSEQLQADWKLERLPIAYGVTIRLLFVSRGRSDDEPPPFTRRYPRCRAALHRSRSRGWRG